MKITVFGAGALGSLVGGLLSTRHEVTLVSREAHARAVNSAGLDISGIIQTRFFPRATTDVDGIEAQDMVFVTVKAYDTPEALAEIRNIVDEKTTVISMQNGLRNADLLTSRYGARSVVSLTSMGATLIAPGNIRYAGKGETVLGSMLNNPSQIEKVRHALTESGLECRVTSDLESDLWMKAIVNACINPITALVRERNGCIEKSPKLKELAREICKEAVEVAKAKGIELPASDPFKKVLEVVRKTADNRSSMLQDVESGRKTEIDEITGEIILEGESLGLDMSHNRILWALVARVPCA